MVHNIENVADRFLPRDLLKHYDSVSEGPLFAVSDEGSAAQMRISTQLTPSFRKTPSELTCQRSMYAKVAERSSNEIAVKLSEED